MCSYTDLASPNALLVGFSSGTLCVEHFGNSCPQIWNAHMLWCNSFSSKTCPEKLPIVCNDTFSRKVIPVVLVVRKKQKPPNYPVLGDLVKQIMVKSFRGIVYHHQKEWGRASLVVQWLRVCLPMQGTRVRALVWEDPTCRGAIRPVSHNYWACTSGICAPQQERPQ